MKGGLAPNAAGNFLVMGLSAVCEDRLGQHIDRAAFSANVAPTINNTEMLITEETCIAIDIRVYWSRPIVVLSPYPQMHHERCPRPSPPAAGISFSAQ